jgi:organic radical activating enzyme
MWKWFRLQHKKKLDTISPSLCLAKWTQSNIYLGSGMTHSCHHPGPHHIPVDEIKIDVSALHNTKYKKQQRQLMLEGIRPTECDYCWKVEDSSNSLSDRITKSFTNWSRPFFKEILTQGANGSNPKYLEISFDNVCNLKCSYCGPTNSSKWMDEINRYGPWPDDSTNHYQQTYIIPNREHNPYIDAFWQWWPDLYPSLHTFRITGGEPLLSKNTFKVLDYIISNPNTNLELSINSNLMADCHVLDKFISKAKQLKVKKLTIHTSCEAYSHAAEYARNGLQYDTWLDNCYKILNSIPDVKLDIMATYNAFSVTTYELFLKDINTLKGRKWFSRVSLSTSYLRNPNFLSIWVLPKTYSDYINSQIVYMKRNRFTANEINELERILELFVTTEQTNLTEFLKFVNEHDRRRQTSFIKTFPEMQDLI